MEATATQTLTQVEFEGSDFDKAEAIAAALGYSQTAYTSTSALWGLFCLADNAEMHEGCVIKTRELGFLFVQNGEDLHMGYDFEDVKAFGSCDNCGHVHGQEWTLCESCRYPRRFTLEEIRAMPTLQQGQYDNLKIDTGNLRVWLSRLTIEDGQLYNNQVMVQTLGDMDDQGIWRTVEEYEAK
jgi:hypothetical protein